MGCERIIRSLHTGTIALSSCACTHTRKHTTGHTLMQLMPSQPRRASRRCTPSGSSPLEPHLVKAVYNDICLFCCEDACLCQSLGICLAALQAAATRSPWLSVAAGGAAEAIQHTYVALETKGA